MLMDYIGLTEGQRQLKVHVIIPFYAYFSTSKLIQNDDTVNYLMRGYYTNKYDVDHRSEENLYIFDMYVAQKRL